MRAAIQSFINSPLAIRETIAELFRYSKYCGFAEVKRLSYGALLLRLDYRLQSILTWQDWQVQSLGEFYALQRSVRYMWGLTAQQNKIYVRFDHTCARSKAWWHSFYGISIYASIQPPLENTLPVHFKLFLETIPFTITPISASHRIDLAAEIQDLSDRLCPRATVLTRHAKSPPDMQYQRYGILISGSRKSAYWHGPDTLQWYSELQSSLVTPFWFVRCKS